MRSSEKNQPLLMTFRQM